MPEFWMCLMQYIAHKIILQIIEQLPRQRPIQNTAKHLRWSVLQPDIFQGN